MMDIPQVIKDLFLTDGIRKNFRVIFPDDDLPDIISTGIVQGSIKFTESACSQDEIKFGLCEASQIEFEAYNIGNIKKKKIQCFIEIDTSSLNQSDRELYSKTSKDIPYPFYRLSLGVFRVTTCPKIDQDVYANDEFEGTVLEKRSVTAYGPSYDFTWDMNSFEQNKIENGWYGDVDVFKWLFVNYMQDGWREFFNDGDLTDLYNETQTWYRQYNSVYDTTPNVSYSLRINIYAQYYPLENGYGTGSMLDLYYLRYNTYSYDSVKAVLHDTIDEWERLYDIQYRSSKEKFISDSIGFMEKGISCYMSSIDGDVNSKSNIYIPSGTYFVTLQGVKPIRNGEEALLSVKHIDLILMENKSTSIAKETIFTVTNDPNTKLREFYMVDVSKYDTGMTLSPDLFITLDPAEIIEGYLELDARFGRYNRDGFLEMYRLNEITDESIMKDTYIQAEYEDEYTKPFDRVSVTYENENNETVYDYFQFIQPIPDKYPEELDPLVDYIENYKLDDYQTYSLGYNYLIQNCTFTSEQIKEILRTIAENLKNVRYLPMNVDLVGRPWLEAGDVVCLNKHDTRYIEEFGLTIPNLGNLGTGVIDITATGTNGLDRVYISMDKYLIVDYDEGIIEIDYKSFLKDYPIEPPTDPPSDTRKYYTSYNFGIKNMFIEFPYDRIIEDYPVEFIIEDGYLPANMYINFFDVQTRRVDPEDGRTYIEGLNFSGDSPKFSRYLSPTSPGVYDEVNRRSYATCTLTGSSESGKNGLIIRFNWAWNISNTWPPDLLPTCRMYFKLPLRTKETVVITPPEFIQTGLVMDYLNKNSGFSEMPNWKNIYTWNFSYMPNSLVTVIHSKLNAYTKPLYNDLQDFEMIFWIEIRKDIEHYDPPYLNDVTFYIRVYEIPPMDNGGEIIWPEWGDKELILNEYFHETADWPVPSLITERHPKLNLKKNHAYEIDILLSSSTEAPQSITGEFSISFLKNGVEMNDKEIFRSIILRRNMDVEYFLRDNFEARGE